VELEDLLSNLDIDDWAFEVGDVDGGSRNCIRRWCGRGGHLVQSQLSAEELSCNKIWVVVVWKRVSRGWRTGLKVQVSISGNCGLLNFHARSSSLHNANSYFTRLGSLVGLGKIERTPW
jgi:hypothetical protein